MFVVEAVVASLRVWCPSPADLVDVGTRPRAHMEPALEVGVVELPVGPLLFWDTKTQSPPTAI